MLNPLILIGSSLRATRELRQALNRLEGVQVDEHALAKTFCCEAQSRWQRNWNLLKLHWSCHHSGKRGMALGLDEMSLLGFEMKYMERHFPRAKYIVIFERDVQTSWRLRFGDEPSVDLGGYSDELRRQYRGLISNLWLWGRLLVLAREDLHNGGEEFFSKRVLPFLEIKSPLSDLKEVSVPMDRITSAEPTTTPEHRIDNLYALAEIGPPS